MFDLIKTASAIDASDLPVFKFAPATDLMTVITNVINFVLFIAGALAVFFLVYGGILYITAGGDPDKASKGKTAVINAVIGIIIILAALLIINWVINFVNNGGTLS